MRSLKFSYFLDLVSNVGAKAQQEAKVLAQAQELMKAAITGTNSKFLDYDKLVLLAGKHMAQMQEVITGATNKFTAMGRAIDQVGHNTSLERQTNYVQRLSAAWGGLEARMGRVVDLGKRAGTLGAAGFAAYKGAEAVVQQPLQDERTYTRQLADAANVAYSDRDVGGRRLGMAALDDAVKASLRAGGGSRTAALGALNDMIASGVVNPDQAAKMLPTIMKYSTAGNAEPAVIANLATKSLQRGFTVEQIPEILDKALVAGQAGGFELRDMAKWLPMLMASGDQAGLIGMKGFERILASAQAAVITAGTKDEAGTNLRDLLSHISSHALKTSAKRMGIDATGMLTKSLGEGDDTLTAVVKLSDFIISRDPRASAMQKTLDAAPTKRDAQGRPVYSEDQLGIMKEQAKLLEGSAIGNLFHNQQSLLALVAERNNRKYIQDVLGQIQTAHGQFGESNFSLISGTNDFRNQQEANEKLFAQTVVTGQLNDALGKLSDSTIALYREHPKLAAAMEGGKLAVGALAASAGLATVALQVFSAKAGMPALPGMPGAPGGAVSGAAMIRMGLYGLLGYEVLQTGSAFYDLYQAKTREGVKLSPDAKRRLAGQPEAGRVDLSQIGLPDVGLPAVRQPGSGLPTDYLSLTAPGASPKTFAPGQPAEVKVGEGRLAIDVRLTDDRVTVTPTVVRQPSLVRIDAGNTNPAGYGRDNRGTRGGQ